MQAMIPFNKPYVCGREYEYIAEAVCRQQIAGNGYFSKKCSSWLEAESGSNKVLLTHSCTAALEMCAILAEIKPGDEIIMPSYTFVSTANAFVLRGGVPVFIDIRMDTLNIDETLIEKAITSKTKAIVVVHYAGVPCEMNKIIDVAKKYHILVIEDAAQGIMSSYKGQMLGSIGDLGCYSFHETKNIVSGEGGALLINNKRFADRAEILWEKGTNRSNFERGDVDKYSWVDIGSSFLPGELTAAFLAAQLEEANNITERRILIWEHYHMGFEILERTGVVQRPSCTHNGHMYYLILNNCKKRKEFISMMSKAGINCVFHYVPLHSSPYGQRVCAKVDDLNVTKLVSSSIVRLPLWLGVEDFQDYIIESTVKILLTS